MGEMRLAEGFSVIASSLVFTEAQQLELFWFSIVVVSFCVGMVGADFLIAKLQAWWGEVTTREALAYSRVAQMVQERLEVFAVLPKRTDPVFQKAQAEDLTMAVFAVYRGALKDDRTIVTGLHGDDKVIGAIVPKGA